MMTKPKVDLAQLFGVVSGVVSQNRAALNDADGINHDHGDHLVDIFNVISRAVEEKRSAVPSQQLAYASKQLKSGAQSGSAKLYADNLAAASKEFKGKSFSIEDALRLVQLLLGASQTPVGSDLLGSLLSGGKAEGQKTTPDATDLLSAGMAFLQAKQSGGSMLDSLSGALIAGSPMSSSPHRAQSGKLIANTLLQAISSLGKK